MFVSKLFYKSLHFIKSFLIKYAYCDAIMINSITIPNIENILNNISPL